MSRKDAEFVDKEKLLIAQRAGYRCSYPKCGKTLIGPGQSNSDFINIGEVAHIYSAAENGPRTSGGLSDEELKRPENGIYLCRSHHKIIDRKSKSEKYTSDMLSRMKSKHEFLISAELGEHNYPVNWVSYIKILKAPMFKSELTLNLGKVTFIYGNNGTGKSTFINLLYSIFGQNLLHEWEKHKTKFLVETALDNPLLTKSSIEIEDGNMTYVVKEKRLPFSPYDFHVFYLEGNYKSFKDDVQTIANCIGFTREYLVKVLATTGIKHGQNTKSLKVKRVRSEPYLIDQILVDLGRGWPDQPFKSCSSTEQASIILDILLSLATEISKFKSVLLLIDWAPLLQFDDNNIQKYLDYLQSSDAHFQSIFVSPREKPKVQWTGWTIANLIALNQSTIINQTIK